ncbi:unnamed protein product [Ectocarpus sp. CCAP 1310/34]|nr:unnamed protein product [Ectocarpus sp. CCAP 1310/34]
MRVLTKLGCRLHHLKKDCCRRRTSQQARSAGAANGHSHKERCLGRRSTS